MAQVDTSIYNALGTRQRSMADYTAELDAADLRKQGMQQNALSLQMGQQKLDEYGRSVQDANALRNALSGLGANATDDARINALKGTGLPGGFAQADALQKAMLERQKTTADVGKTQADTLKTQLAAGLQKFEIVGQVMSGVRDQATYDLARRQLAQTFGPEMAQNMPPAYDPMTIEQNKAKAMSVKDQMAQRLQQIEFEQRQANDMLVPDPRNPGKFMPNQPLINAKTQVAQAGASAINNYGSPVAGVDAEGKPVFFQPTKTGGAPSIVPGVRPPKDPNAEKPLTEGQGIATTFAARMQDASRVIDALEASGTSGSDFGTIAAGNRVTNVGAPAEGQQYRQAQENWVTANLRKESGAAIPVEEMNKDIAKWFPKIGDKKEVRDQKARARKVAEQGMLVQAGPGAKQVQGILDRSAPRAAAPAANADLDAALKQYLK